MAEPNETAFEGKLAEEFAHYGDTLRGYVRYEMVHRRLANLIRGQTLEIIDVGGGSGVDALWLAERGQHVTVLDPSRDQLMLGRARLKTATPEARKRVNFVQGTMDKLEDVEHIGYDLALAHAVSMYTPRPDQFIKRLAQLVKPKTGQVSVLEKGFFGAEERLLGENRYEDLLRLKRDGRVVNNRGLDVKAFYPSQLESYFTEAGLRVLAWNGVRILSESVEKPVSDFTGEQLDAIVGLEWQVGNEKSTRGMGQLLHFVGQRTS